MATTLLFPSVSILIPIRNEPRSIERGLSSLLKQDYPADRIEILIIDGMSTDHTRESIEGFAAAHPELNILVLDNPGKIVPTAMNIALHHAKGEILIRVDGHTAIAPDYVRKCVEHLQSDGVDGVGGPTESIGETPVARAIAIAMSSPFGIGNASFRLRSRQSVLVDTIPFPAYTRGIVQRAGLYDEELVRDQDDEYNYRIRKLGGKLLLVPDVHSNYYVRSSFEKLWRQYYQYGFYKVRVLQKHPRQMQVRQFVPPLFVLALCASALLALFSLLPGFSTSFDSRLPSLLPLLYLVVDLFASVLTAANKGWKYLPLLPVIFAILHVSYGIGFLVGLVKFAGRWTDQAGEVPDW